MNFYQSFLKKCIEKGVSPSRAAEEAGTTKTAVNRWKAGSTPSDATVMKLALYFGCTVDELTAKSADTSDEQDATGADELAELRQILRERPEMKMLFDAGMKSTPQTVRQTAQFLEGLASEKEAD